MIQTQFGTGVKIIRTINGTEFFNTQCNELLKSLGIMHLSSCPYTLQQNGVVEKKHRQTLNIARTIRFQSCMPIM